MSNNDNAPLIPLVVPEREVPKEKQSSFRVYSVPGDSSTTRYDFNVNHIDGEEGVPYTLHFCRQIAKLRLATNVTNPDQMPAFSALITTMLYGQSKVHYKAGVQMRRAELLEQARAEKRTEHLNNAVDKDNMTADELTAMNAAVNAVEPPQVTLEVITMALNFMIRQIVPVGALARVKRHLRRGCRKPADMTIRSYTTALRRINEEDLMMLPPFLESNRIPDDEMKEIIQYAIPNSWNRKLREQSKDPLLMSYFELVTTLENYESAEVDFDATAKSGNSNGKGKKTNNSAKKGKGVTSKPKSEGSEGNQFCLLHKWNPTHSTDECKTLKKLAEAQKAKSSGSKNKTWKRPKDDSPSKDDTKKEVQAFVKEAFKSELKAAKKRKTKDLNNVEIDRDGDWADVDFEALESFANDDGSVDSNE